MQPSIKSICCRDSVALVSAARDQGLSVADAEQLADVAETLDGPSVQAIINAVREDNSSKLLSTPHIMTLDNREATVAAFHRRFRGRDVPVIRRARRAAGCQCRACHRTWQRAVQRHRQPAGRH